MKVLLLPTEIAGQVNLTAQGLRKIGLKAYNTARPDPRNYPIDIDPRIKNPLFRNIRNPLLFFKWLNEFDLFHYNKSPYLPAGIDVKLLRKRQIPFVIEFWGSDIRLYKLEKERNPYFTGDNATNQERKLNRLKFWSELTNEVIFSDHSADIFLKPYFKKIHIVGQRIDTSLFKPAYPSPENKKPVIVHAPSVKATKGTEYVVNAIEKLRKMGLDFEYIEVFGMTHQEAVKVYSGADIIVDELLMGSYGVLSCEAMALGKPVITYIIDDLFKTYPEGLPIVNANVETIGAVLEELICSPEKRYDLGRKGRTYVEKVHDIKVVAAKLLEVYKGKMSL